MEITEWTLSALVREGCGVERDRPSEDSALESVLLEGESALAVPSAPSARYLTTFPSASSNVYGSLSM